ncbi:MAG: ECF transporter S component [Oscillospiraceae bacterium]|nr:ECF transporter S component [Oscillospiraceae bacterium]
MKRKHVYHIALTAVLAALTTTLIIFNVSTGAGIIHAGDAIILLAAVLLPTPYAMLVGAIGGGLHNILFIPMWAPATIVIKAAITVPFSAKQPKMLTKRNILALIPYALITLLGYGFYEVWFITQGPWLEILLASMLRNSVQIVASSILFIVLTALLDKTNFKQRIGL